MKILGAINRADRMIEDLLDANRIRAGHKLPLAVSEFNIADLFRRTIDELSMVHGPRFALNYEDTRGHWSYEALRRVIENLCNNAIKYGAQGGLVKLSVKRHKDKVKILVHNIGGELNINEQKTLFDQFRRSWTADRSRQKGWGIGLTLVRGIVEAHNGTITVSSGHGLGTTFEILLPIDCRI